MPHPLPSLCSNAPIERPDESSNLRDGMNRLVRQTGPATLSRTLDGRRFVVRREVSTTPRAVVASRVLRRFRVVRSSHGEVPVVLASHTLSVDIGFVADFESVTALRCGPSGGFSHYSSLNGFPTRVRHSVWNQHDRRGDEPEARAQVFDADETPTCASAATTFQHDTTRSRVRPPLPTRISLRHC